eukprot:TRINITY_DN8296_c0_g1_i1.p2 TRINITY_DN8296_c0_g1~~TRINITY_DN8296_c0_g1_i1.p2  ORF type:complete len:146 (-),score=43.85 TRINITY_DN8296_c0_g1_i1:318-755(-)
MARQSVAVLAMAFLGEASLSAPSTYCKKFSVDGTPLKIKVDFKDGDKIDVYADVAGFAMSCMAQPYTKKSDGALAIEKKNGENCLQEHFEEIAADWSDVHIKYDSDDCVRISASGSVNECLKKNADCKDMEFLLPERRLGETVVV